MHPWNDLLVTQSPLSTDCGIGVRDRGRTISVCEVTTPKPLHTGPLSHGPIAHRARGTCSTKLWALRTRQLGNLVLTHLTLISSSCVFFNHL